MNTPPSPPNPHPRRRPVLALLVGCLLALVTAELVARLLPTRPEPPLKVYDPLIGFKLRPGMTGVWNREREAPFAINRLGFRDVEWTAAKRRPFRIAILGDSFAEALQVERTNAFPALLERLLPEAEVLNFGVSGQATTEEWLTYRHYARPFRPDLVVLCFFPGNDPNCDFRRTRPRLTFPYTISLADNGALTLHTNAAALRCAPLLRLRDEALYRSLLVGWAFEARRASFHRSMKGALTEAGLWDGVFGDPDGRVPDFEPTWRLTEALVGALNTDVTADLGRTNGLLVACLTEGVQVQAPQREAFLAAHPNLNPDYAEKRLAGCCARLGIPFLGLGEPLRAANRATGRLLHGFDVRGHGHYNLEGHQAAAHALAEAIRPLLPAAAPENRKP